MQVEFETTIFKILGRLLEKILRRNFPKLHFLFQAYKDYRQQIKLFILQKI